MVPPRTVTVPPPRSVATVDEVSLRVVMVTFEALMMPPPVQCNPRLTLFELSMVRSLTVIVAPSVAKTALAPFASVVTVPPLTLIKADEPEA